MKAIALFFTLALYIQFEDVTSQVKYQEGMCWEFQQLFINGNLYCNRDIDPIIGPNGKTHTNKCVMCRELLRKRGIAGSNGSGWSKDSSSGVDESCREYWPYFIKGGVFCTRELNPVRDASGKQHNNKCMMCLQQFKNGGKMNSLEQRQPQYGNNEKFDNCYEYRSQIGPNGELTCTRENDPVRDDSGQTHSNKCIMCAEQFKKEARQGKLFSGNGKGQPSPYSNGNTATQGDYKQGNLNETDCSKYPQTRGQVLCKPSPPEVCGTDGVTYKNECALCNQILKTKSEIDIQNIGPCPKRKL